MTTSKKAAPKGASRSKTSTPPKAASTPKVAKTSKAKAAPARAARSAGAAKPAAKAARPTGKAANYEGYVAGLLPWQAEVVTALTALVKKAAPRFEAPIKWGHPVYEQNGKPFALVRAASKHVLFGFWGRVSPKDPAGLLEGSSLRHVKVTTVAEATRPEIAAMLREALVLNGAA